MANEGRITHASIGRINVERSANPAERCLTLRLFQWSLSPEATLEFSEVRRLITRLEAVMAQGTTASDAEDPYDVG